jgi:hypothetical protein
LGWTGVCWGSAAAESFFAALKNEMYYRQSSPTERAPLHRCRDIEILYDRRRLHSTPGYRTPFEASPSTEPRQPPRRD